MSKEVKPRNEINNRQLGSSASNNRVETEEDDNDQDIHFHGLEERKPEDEIDTQFNYLPNGNDDNDDDDDKDQ